nr:hypothetical protein [Ardenticatena sp.]
MPHHPTIAQRVIDSPLDPIVIHAPFAGQCRTFDLPSDWQPLDLSPFQHRILEAVQRRPWGTTQHVARLWQRKRCQNLVLAA